MAGDHAAEGGVARSPGQELPEHPDLSLTLPARAENVAVVRHAIGGLGEALDVGDQTLSDVKLAVTEACTNTVVRDEGLGIVPRTDSPGLGLGLPLIATLAESLELGTDEGKHTEVRMTFRL